MGMKVFVEPMGFAPTRAHSTDAGLDLYAIDDTTVPARGSAVFRTGVHIELPPNTFGKIESRSGLNIVSDVVSCGGVIDQNYRGEILVKLYNLGHSDYCVKRGDRIAQLVVIPCLFVDVDITEGFNADTDRGSRGFGSTGK